MKIEIELPQWTVEETEQLPPVIADPEERMRAVIRFAQLNLEHQTGGPFAAGVFETHTGRLVVMGVNRAVPSNVSSAHAEIVALSLAQQKLNNVDLGGPGMTSHQLVVSGRPCAMCFGAIPWSGIRSLMIAASGPQIEDLAGFDEGPIHPQWQAELQARGIEVVEDVLADEACQVLRNFAASGQPVYNGRQGDPDPNPSG